MYCVWKGVIAILWYIIVFIVYGRQWFVGQHIIQQSSSSSTGLTDRQTKITPFGPVTCLTSPLMDASSKWCSADNNSRAVSVCRTEGYPTVQPHHRQYTGTQRDKSTEAGLCIPHRCTICVPPCTTGYSAHLWHISSSSSSSSSPGVALICTTYTDGLCVILTGLRPSNPTLDQYLSALLQNSKFLICFSVIVKCFIDNNTFIFLDGQVPALRKTWVSLIGPCQQGVCVSVSVCYTSMSGVQPAVFSKSTVSSFFIIL